MILVIILIMTVFLVAAIFCPYRILRSPATSSLYRWTTVLTGIVVAGLAYVLTFYHVYTPNSNTRVHGWPIPVVVFQRDGPGEPWLDFVGPTMVLGFPMNLILLLGVWFFVLWILNIIITKTRKRTSEPPSPGDAATRAAPDDSAKGVRERPK